MSKKLVIFDADSMVFTVAWKFRDKNVKSMVTMHLNKFISDVIENAGATHYTGFFAARGDSVKPNFRYALDPTYKLTRPETPEWVVKWRPILHEVMENKWGFIGIEGMEADDAVSITAHKYKNDYDEIIVAACDKDLEQIPNITYYNYSKHLAHKVNAFDAAMNLSKQVLTGDATDNIKGLNGIGPKKAEKILGECTTVTQLKWAVARLYAGYEADLKAKAEKSVFEDVKAEMLAQPDFDKNKYSDKQFERLVRIAAKTKVSDTMFKEMPGGWKKYLRLQYALLTLLTESPDWFIVPEPKESKLAFTAVPTSDPTDLGAPETKVEVKATSVKPIDNFLYL